MLKTAFTHTCLWMLLCTLLSDFHPHLPLNASSTWRKSSRLHDISFRIQSASYTENPDRPSSIRLRERILRQDYQERMRRVCNSISQDQVLALWGNIVALGKLRCNGAGHEDWEGDICTRRVGRCSKARRSWLADHINKYDLLMTQLWKRPTCTTYRGARYCQCLSTTFRTLASSSSPKHQLQQSLSYSTQVARCPLCCWGSRQMRLSGAWPLVMDCRCSRCTISSTWCVGKMILTHDKCGSVYLRIQSSEMELNSRWKSLITNLVS
jgi:uncharacterized protein YggL (DUF469 family)